MKNWEQKDIQDLCAKTVRVIIERLSTNLSDNVNIQMNSDQDESEEDIKKKRTLVLLPQYTFAAGRVLTWIEQQDIKPDYIQINADKFEEEDQKTPFNKCNIINIDTLHQRHKLINELHYYKQYLIITPSLDTIASLASGDDSSFETMLMLRPLLWGSLVTMILDFELPRHRRGFAKLVDDLNTLEQMGIIIHRLGNIKDTVPRGEKDLITAKDVEDACIRGESLKAAQNAIITQLALDTAGELGVIIE